MSKYAASTEVPADRSRSEHREFSIMKWLTINKRLPALIKIKAIERYASNCYGDMYKHTPIRLYASGYHDTTFAKDSATEPENTE